MDTKKFLTHQYELNRLKNSTEDVIKDKTLSQGFNKTIEGVTEHIDNSPHPRTSGDDFVKKIANFRTAKALGKKVLGAVPVLGGLASAAMSGDASAAVPLLGEADNLGPAAGTLDHRIEMGQLTDEDKAQLRMQALRNIK